MSGSETIPGLADRLVTAAVKAQQDGMGVEEKARLSVAAVLRELERHASEDMDGDLIHALDLAEWAGVVEEGEKA